MPCALLATLPLAMVEPCLAANEQQPPVKFNEQIKPLLMEHCVACHGGVKQASGLSFIYRDKALAEAESGDRAIVPGDVEGSSLVDRIVEPDDDFRMPPSEHGPRLCEQEVELFKRWIAEGATWGEHWSFVAPQRQRSPPVDRPEWLRTSIDAFVLARLESEGLAPSPEASKLAWLRRVTLDLTGLPPSLAEREMFLADQGPLAYERVVDRLLASPRYGERWAAMWLDLARYADTMGYEKDPHRDIWPYRDWLIRALNDDLPYDQFLIKQLAGDLLPEASLADRIASGLHRNTQTNTEGGTDDEEFRTAAVLDRVSTTWQLAAGLTFGCAQCHSHPYDPIEHEEYYKFVAVFNSTRDHDLSADLPRLEVPNNRDDWPRAEQLDREIERHKNKLYAWLEPLASDVSVWKPVTMDTASSTGQTKLVSRIDQATGVAEVVTEGTVSVRSRFTVSGPVPDAVQTITALRIDALPKSPAEAKQIPEMGFAVTRLRATLQHADGTSSPPQALSFRTVVSDDPSPQFDPSDSLRDNSSGWSSFPKIDRPHWAVFVLAEPLEIPSGSRLELVIKHDREATGAIPVVLDRARYAVTSDPRFAAVVNREDYVAAEQQLAALRAERNAMQTTSTLVMAELPRSQTRNSYIFERGNWLSKGAKVEPGVPALFPPLDGEANRLGVAKWFVSGEHPLTSRTMVNRIWEQLFGIGLVETAGDLGSSGLEPSHPKLLDDLAVRFQDDMQWSTKRLLKELVLSATYRQTARSTSELNQRDPRNRLLARGPRLRLTAEMVRDQALQLSGKLVDTMYGPPVMPPQPEGVWQSVYSGASWQTATGDNRFRRAVYTYWKRTSPYPSMTTFDAPSREVCTVRRVATNTPLQALVTLNDPAFLECSQGLAERMATEGGPTANQQITWALQLATCKPAPAPAVAALVTLYGEAYGTYDASNPQHSGLGDTREGYARTIVANAILNLDDVLTR